MRQRGVGGATWGAINTRGQAAILTHAVTEDEAARAAATTTTIVTTATITFECALKDILLI